MSNAKPWEPHVLTKDARALARGIAESTLFMGPKTRGEQGHARTVLNWDATLRQAEGYVENAKRTCEQCDYWEEEKELDEAWVALTRERDAYKRFYTLWLGRTEPGRTARIYKIFMRKPAWAEILQELAILEGQPIPAISAAISPLDEPSGNSGELTYPTGDECEHVPCGPCSLCYEDACDGEDVPLPVDPEDEVEGDFFAAAPDVETDEIEVVVEEER